MAISERQRRDVFVKLEELLGEETADHLMQMLPRSTNDELATRTDLTAQSAILRGEMAELRAELRGEMAELRTDLQGEMQQLRSDVSAQLAGMQRWMAAVIAANGVAVVTALVA